MVAICTRNADVVGSIPTVSTIMTLSSSGKDTGFSRRKREFNSPQGQDTTQWTPERSRPNMRA